MQPLQQNRGTGTRLLHELDKWDASKGASRMQLPADGPTAGLLVSRAAEGGSNKNGLPEKAFQGRGQKVDVAQIDSWQDYHRDGKQFLN